MRGLELAPTLAERLHLAFVLTPVMRSLLDGTQRCESRLSKRLPPAWSVRPGDALLFKCGAGRGYARVNRVDRFEVAPDAAPDDGELMEQYTRYVDGPEPDDTYWHAKRDSRFAVFMFLDPVVKLYIPGELLPSTRSAWVSDYRPSREVRQELLEQLS